MRWILITAISAIVFSYIANGAEMIQPVVENVPLYSANGTKIGVLHKQMQVKFIQEANNNMIFIEYSDENISVRGWAHKSHFKVVADGDKTSAQSYPDPTTPAKTATGPATAEIKTSAPERLSVADTRRELRSILKVPVNYIQQTTVDTTRVGTRRSSAKATEQTRLFMKLNPGDKNSDGYAEIGVLLEFDRDDIVTFFVNEKITSLEDFKDVAALEYRQVIDFYIQALQKYNEDLRGNFRTLTDRAARFERVIR